METHRGPVFPPRAGGRRTVPTLLRSAAALRRGTECAGVLQPLAATTDAGCRSRTAPAAASADRRARNAARRRFPGTGAQRVAHRAPHGSCQGGPGCRALLDARPHAESSPERLWHQLPAACGRSPLRGRPADAGGFGDGNEPDRGDARLRQRERLRTRVQALERRHAGALARRRAAPRARMLRASRRTPATPRSAAGRSAQPARFIARRPAPSPAGRSRRRARDTG